MLETIKIEGLFNKFNYEIDLKKEGITILTGPNGYGKTTILKIIHEFANDNRLYFSQLPFKLITLTHNSKDISLLKNDEKIEIKNGNDKPSIYIGDKIIKGFLSKLENLPFRKLDDEHWIDIRTDNILTFTDLINHFPDVTAFPMTSKKNIPDFVNVYLIREQRLIRKISIYRKKNMRYYEEDTRNIFSNTIEEYSKELSKNINDILASASKIGQELDSSFPRRLFEQNEEIGEDEFNKRYDVIKEKQKALSLYGLSAIKEDHHTSFSPQNNKALLVYLNDTEKKLTIFDEILKKLELFSTILNHRQFVFKKLEISSDFGFKFTTEDGKDLALTDLSSGEQQEVVLLYELLFKVEENTLVLIDEPEISLHVAWQKEVLDDLLKIIELQKITVITATHSPQIIGKHWNLVVDLEEISR